MIKEIIDNKAVNNASQLEIEELIFKGFPIIVF